jgi:hypothetical protein
VPSIFDKTPQPLQQGYPARPVRGNVKARTSMSITAMTLFAVLAIEVDLAAQNGAARLPKSFRSSTCWR